MEINELKKKLNAGIYNHCGLYTLDGKKIIPLNTKAEKYSDNVKNILNMLSNPEFNDGNYLAKYKVTYNGTTEQDFVSKGERNETTPQVMNNTALNLPHDFAAAMDHPAIKLQTEITRLELENDDLNRQIEELNEYVKELEEKVNAQQLAELPQPPSALDSAKSFLTELATMAAPLIDQHYQLKAQALEIERAKLQQAPKPASVQRSLEVNQEKALENKVKAWINSKADDNELFNNLTAIYYNSQDLQKFAELLNEYNPNLYAECKRAVG